MKQKCKMLISDIENQNGNMTATGGDILVMMTIQNIQCTMYMYIFVSVSSPFITFFHDTLHFFNLLQGNH